MSLEDYVNHFHVRPHKAIIIPNGVLIPPFDFKKLTARREKIWQTPRIAWVGRVSQEKRLDFILKSLAIFSHTSPQARLVMVGDGPYREEAMQYASELSIAERIEWVGYRKNVIPFLLKSHLFLHACLSEEFGYTLVEAMTTGLPVIAYDCPHGPREILDGGRYGILVKTEEEMAQAMRELMKDVEFWREFSSRAFKRARDFDLRKISEQYRETFRKLLS
ncbi:MAG: glycosyltransferase [Thermodesulforhabdaceae bacterium]